MSVLALNSELRKLGVPLSPSVVTLARKSELMRRLDAPVASWSSGDPQETEQHRILSRVRALKTALATALFAFSFISEGQSKQMAEDGLAPDVADLTDAAVRSRYKELVLNFHPDRGSRRFCQEHKITNAEDWIQALNPTLTRAFQAFQVGYRI